jgi:hypothetical protein
MDLIKAEIARKKRQMEEKGVMAGPNKKYFKRGDLAEKQREEYLAKHAPKLDGLKQLEQAKAGNKEKSKILYFSVHNHFFSIFRYDIRDQIKYYANLLIFI